MSLSKNTVFLHELRRASIHPSINQLGDAVMDDGGGRKDHVHFMTVLVDAVLEHRSMASSSSSNVTLKT